MDNVIYDILVGQSDLTDVERKWLLEYDQQDETERRGGDAYFELPRAAMKLK